MLPKDISSLDSILIKTISLGHKYISAMSYTNKDGRRRSTVSIDDDCDYTLPVTHVKLSYARIIQGYDDSTLKDLASISERELKILLKQHKEPSKTLHYLEF